MTYLSGRLHRDISLGTVLMVDGPVRRKEFEIPREFRDHLLPLRPKGAVEGI